MKKNGLCWFLALLLLVVGAAPTKAQGSVQSINAELAELVVLPKRFDGKEVRIDLCIATHANAESMQCTDGEGTYVNVKLHRLPSKIVEWLISRCAGQKVLPRCRAVVSGKVLLGSNGVAELQVESFLPTRAFAHPRPPEIPEYLANQEDAIAVQEITSGTQGLIGKSVTVYGCTWMTFGAQSATCRVFSEGNFPGELIAKGEKTDREWRKIYYLCREGSAKPECETAMRGILAKGSLGLELRDARIVWRRPLADDGVPAVPAGDEMSAIEALSVAAEREGKTITVSDCLIGLSYNGPDKKELRCVVRKDGDLFGTIVFEPVTWSETDWKYVDEICSHQLAPQAESTPCRAAIKGIIRLNKENTPRLTEASVHWINRQ